MPATILPLLSENELNALSSKAEAKLYRSLRDSLPQQVLVLYSVSWVTTPPRSSPRDGEADFVVFDPRKGMLVIEVKGGGVSFRADTGEWCSLDAAGTRHSIKDPFRQACGEKHALLGLIRSHPSWGRLGNRRIAVGHSVFFPDVSDVRPLVSPQRPCALIGGRDDLSDLPKFIANAFSYWSTTDVTAKPLGADGIASVRECLCSDIDVRPLLSIRLGDEETQRVRLTSQQARLLRSLGSRVRAAISGAAGTGKTILAMEKARDAAASGQKTLLLCYNRPLSDWMKRSLAPRDNLHIMTYHQLCDWRAAQVLSRTGRDLMAEARSSYPNGDRFEVHLPHALALSTETLSETYDAIIVDEGQDFSDDYWLSLELLLTDTDRGLLFVFYDRNQAVYRESRNFPIPEAPFPLTVNCRNTQSIHDLAYRYYQGDATEPCEIGGSPVKVLIGSTLSSQARSISNEIRSLISRHRIHAGQVVVLVNSETKVAMYDVIRCESLPSGVRWAVEDHAADKDVLVDTVFRFKGLESTIVFLWLSAELRPDEDAKVLYIGTSRAKSLLFVVGTRDTVDRVLQIAPDS